MEKNMKIFCLSFFFLTLLVGCSAKRTPYQIAQKVAHASSGRTSPEVLRQVATSFPWDEKDIQINALWPSELLVRLPIRPAIPKNFVLKTISADDGTFAYFVWGPKEVLDAFDPHDCKTLTQPVLAFRLSSQITQTGHNGFFGIDRLIKDLESHGDSSLAPRISLWGTYPVLTINGNVRTEAFTSAWIGLNCKSLVLFARLIIPGNQNGPTQQDLQLWNTFITETTPLSADDSLCVLGHEWHSGYTNATMGTAKFTYVAQRRNSDNMVQIAVIPLTPSTHFSLNKIGQEFLTIQLHGLERVNVNGNLLLREEEGGSLVAPDFSISIFIDQVENFSLDTTMLQQDHNVFVRQFIMPPLSLPPDELALKPLSPRKTIHASYPESIHRTLKNSDLKSVSIMSSALMPPTAQEPLLPLLF